MTAEMRFEGTLRTALRAQRPAAGAPAELRSRVLEIPIVMRNEPMALRLLRGFGVPMAAVGIGAAAVALAAVGFTRAPVTGLPPVSGGTPTGFDPSIVGPGLITSVAPTAALLGLLVVVVAGAVAGGTFFSARAGTNRGRVIVLLGLLGVAAGIALIRFDAGLSDGSTRAAPLGYVEAPAGAFHDDQIVWVQTAAPGEPTVGLFSLRNEGILPVRIEGIVVDEHYSELQIAHWTALWVPLGEPGPGAPGLGQVRPFEPVTLEPGAELNVYAAGMAGQCAYGPLFDPTTEDQSDYAGMSQLGPVITVAYSVFGLASTAQIDIEEVFGEPGRNSCFGG
jgi:hypothetical protein